MNILKTSILYLLVSIVFLGIIYPAFIFGITFLPFRQQQIGEPIVVNNTIVGYKNLGQKFTSKKYFLGRPSAGDYATVPSGASNISPYSKKMIDFSKTATDSIRADGYNGIIPSDVLTTSASGLDPHISVESALLQVQRIAKLRSVSPEQITTLVNNSILDRQLMVFGQKRVNVLELNILLDKNYPIQ